MIGKRIANLFLGVTLLVTLWLPQPAVAARVEPSAPARQPAVPQAGSPPLPVSCIGGGTPLHYDEPVCCVSGYVYQNGAPVAAASVTVSANGQEVTTQTQYFEGSDLPYYFLSLYEAPLDVRPGQSVTVTASLGSFNRSEVFTAQAGGQQVDILLPQTETTYQMTMQNHPADPAPGHSSGLSYLNSGQSLLMGGSQLDPATHLWNGSAWSVQPASNALAGNGWNLTCVDCPRYFENMTERSLRLDANGRPHVAYGGDQLYYAWQDGTAWHTEVVDQAAGVGSYASLALDSGGYAHISYFDAVNTRLKYAWQDASGWHIQTLDTNTRAGTYTSLALDSRDNAHISYYDIANANLKYAWQDGARWYFENVDEIGDVGRSTSLALDDHDFVHISYRDVTNGKVKYASQTINGWDFKIIDYGGDPNTSLVLDGSGSAHISYSTTNTYQLKYAQQEDTGWNIRVVGTISSVSIDCGFSSLALDSHGFAHISYSCTSFSYGLGYIRQITATSWQSWSITSGELPSYFSMALNNDLPVMVYSSRHSQIKYAWLDANLWRAEIIDTAYDRGQYTSLALDRAGDAHIGYYDFVAQDLRYAWQDAGGWNSQIRAEVGDVGLYNSLTLDHNDYPYISYYDNSSLRKLLKFTWQNQTGWHTTNVESLGVDIRNSISLALDGSGYAHLSYCESTKYVKYARESDAGWQIETIATDSNCHVGPSLVLDQDGKAHIAYNMNGAITYIYQTPSGWQSEPVAAYNSGGKAAALDIALGQNGAVYILYGGLTYAWRDAEKTWHFRSIPNGGGYGSLALDKSGYPHISYYDSTAGDLKYTWQDASGWYTQTVDSIGDVGQYNSLALDADGNAHISYYDVTNHDLKYAYDGIITQSPTRRYGHTLSPNADGSTLLTFGGMGVGGVYLGDTYLWNGSAWNVVTPAAAPPARAYYGLAYDGHNQEWVLFGGRDQNGRMNDTWLFDGVTWSQAQPAHVPPARAEATLTYDARRQRVVLVAGRGAAGVLADVWEWDGSDWTQISPTTPLPARAGHAAAYDSTRQVVVIAGGQGASSYFADLWEWDGAAWTQRVSAPALPAMAHLAMTYDPVHDQLVIVGGENASGLVQGTFLLSPEVTPASAPPVASIFRIAPRDARPDETLSFEGRGADADSSGSGSEISAYRWMWAGNLLSSAAAFTVPAGNFTCGEHEVSFQVQDNEGQWSQPVQQHIFIRDHNGGICKGSSWTMLVYAAGDNNLGADLSLMLERLRYAGTLPNVQVGVLYDGPGANDTRRYTLTANGEWGVQTLPEARMDEMETLRDFIRWGFATFETDYYFLSLADHASGAIGFAQDLSSLNSNTNPKPFLTPIELRSALQDATGDGAHKIDILMFDGCSFGLFEDAAIAAGQTQLVIASPNTGWGEFAYERYRQFAALSDSPLALAQNVANAYTQEVRSSNPNWPYTISVFDLARFETTRTAIDQLGNSLRSYIQADPGAHLAEIQSIRTLVQKYDSGGSQPYETDDEDSYVDLVSLAERLRENLNDATIHSAASAVIDAIQGPQPFVVYERHASGQFEYYDPSVGKRRQYTVNLEQAHGIGIFYPPRSTALPNTAYQKYITNQLFDITARWNWTAFLKTDSTMASDFREVPPLMDDALIVPLLPPKQIFFPLIQRP